MSERDVEKLHDELRREKLRTFFGDVLTPETHQELETHINRYYADLGHVALLRDTYDHAMQKLHALEKGPIAISDDSEMSIDRFLQKTLDLITAAKPGGSVHLNDYYFLLVALKELERGFPQDEEIHFATARIQEYYNEQLRLWREANEQGTQKPTPPPLEISSEIQKMCQRLPDLIKQMNARANDQARESYDTDLQNARTASFEALEKYQEAYTKFTKDAEPLKQKLAELQKILSKQIRESAPQFSVASPEETTYQAQRFSDWKWKNLSLVFSNNSLESALVDRSQGNHFDSFVVIGDAPHYVLQWHETVSPLLAFAVAEPGIKTILIRGDRLSSRSLDEVPEVLRKNGPTWIVSEEGLLELPELLFERDTP